MSLAVLEVRGLATIQDSGRSGWRRFGVPVSGPMDMFAFNAANALVGNSMDCAVIEVGMGDITFQAKQDCILSVTGLGYKLSVYTWQFPLWDSFLVRAGWNVHLSKTGHGMWAYLAVNGGFQTPPVLGSRSTYLRGALGGFEGRLLQAGDLCRTADLARVPYELAARSLPVERRLQYQGHPVIDVIMGPQTDYFTDESIRTFLTSEYAVILASDRMGYRLEGPALARRDIRELISEGMAVGTIQIPPNGQPIVMMADCPTTGGYPRIGVVARADLPLLAQCVPNKSRIRFRVTTVEGAQQRWRELNKGLNTIVQDE